MIPSISKGVRTIGILYYLYGPGRRGEHVAPHLVASFDGFAPDPGRDPEATIAQLAKVLDLRVDQKRAVGEKLPAKHVWQCSLRVAPEDRTLAEPEWEQIARRVLDAAGIAPFGDPDGCRWIAVRHAEDHIHILATRVRGDLRPARNWHDYRHVDAECQQIEKDFGLRQVERRDPTAARRPTKAEQRKAERTGRIARTHLATSVRTAAAYAANAEEFFGLLERFGILVHPTLDPHGTIRGYKVALPDDRNAADEPVWFGGRTLAPDLSWTRVQERLTAHATSADNATDTGDGGGDMAPPLWQDLAATNSWDRAPAHLDRITALLHEATAAAEDGDTSLSRAGGTTRADTIREKIAAAHLAAVGQLMTVLPDALQNHPLPAGTRQDLRDAAAVFARAARSSGKAAHAQTRAAGSTFRMLTDTLLSDRSDGAELVGDLLAAALLAVIAVVQWHQANKHQAQARAAAEAVGHLRNAYRATAPKPLEKLTAAHTPGPRLAAMYAEVTRTVLTRRSGPTSAAAVLGDPAMAALTAAIHRGVKNDHNVLVLIDQAVTSRELATADNPAEVLTWRIHRLARTHPATAARRGNRAPQRRTGKAATTSTTARTGTSRPVPPPAANPATRRTR
ncbi:mobilization protein [Yinghuangia sp. ASG 101]|uniref:relaxase/mobilization nuclease domain-containing protein n=1 Tax=Yinghuangia sp. ASG 101 TaxID=2896848 RepID=UPI001E31809D|nr:mobilization protein [Yinghuangia sp. ASG 101]UGQ14854.1 mobilization protein [Yinghuangia sp. ASG 101]